MIGRTAVTPLRSACSSRPGVCYRRGLTEAIDSAPAAVEPARSPLPATQRIVTLDVLRGVALLGIFIMNMPGFTHSLFAQPVPEATAVDRAVVMLREALFAGKFNLLFGLLFGIGFTLQLARLGAADGPLASASASASGSRRAGDPRRAVLVYARRLAVLLAIGLVHAVLLWPGDVLVVYAVLGFVLLALRKISDRAVLVLLALCLLYPAASDALRPVLLPIQTEAIAAFEYQDFEASNDQAFGHGSVIDVAVETARVFVWGYTSPLGLYSYAAFYVQMATGILIGFFVGRRGWVRRLPELAAPVRRAQWSALAIVLAAAAVWWAAGGATADPQDAGAAVFVSGLAKTIGRAALAAVYALSVARLLALPHASRWLLPFERAGRMPLSNYLLQTLMASAIFYGWGLGLWGHASPSMETLLAVGLFAVVQLPLSTWWLSRFRYGPVEYLWRLLTYGKRAL